MGFSRAYVWFSLRKHQQRVNTTTLAVAHLNGIQRPYLYVQSERGRVIFEATLRVWTDRPFVIFAFIRRTIVARGLSQHDRRTTISLRRARFTLLCGNRFSKPYPSSCTVATSFLFLMITPSSPLPTSFFARPLLTCLAVAISNVPAEFFLAERFPSLFSAAILPYAMRALPVRVVLRRRLPQHSCVDMILSTPHSPVRVSVRGSYTFFRVLFFRKRQVN